jgi:signal transduction histidine kinase
MLCDLILHPETLHMAELVRRVVSRFAEASAQAGCDIILDLEEGLCGRWDPYRLEQMLGNLLSNAIKYAPGKPISLSARRQGERVLLNVRDQGPGIPTDKLAEIFERYAHPLSSKVNLGMGLGLYITRGLVDAHGGAIEAENTRRKGASIKIALPLETNASYSGVRIDERRTGGIGA